MPTLWIIINIDLLSIWLMFILITESWLCASVPDGLLLSNASYTVYQKYTKHGHGGGWSPAF